MEGNTIVPQQIRIRLKNGIGKMPFPIKNIVLIDLPEELYQGFTLYERDNTIHFKRTLLQKVKDFFIPIYINIFYNHAFDNSQTPAVFRMYGHTIPIPKTFSVEDALNNNNNHDFYWSVVDSFDGMLKSLDDNLKMFLAAENYDKVAKYSDAKAIVESYKEKMLDNIIEHKGNANKPILYGMLDKMISEVSILLPELGMMMEFLSIKSKR